MPKLLIVEDEIDLADQLRDWFLREKYLVDLVYDGEEALNNLSAYKYDAIVLDWMIPSISGIDVLKEYRRKGGKTPVIILSARSQSQDVELGLDSGSDYYLKKPVSLKELSASIRAVLRRGEGNTAGNTIVLGNMFLDPVRHIFKIDGETVHLEPKEFNLIEFLLRHPNQVFTNDALIDRVWPSETLISRDAVRTYIKSLRKKIGSRGKDSVIKNIRGIGYKLEIDE